MKQIGARHKRSGAVGESRVRHIPVQHRHPFSYLLLLVVVLAHGEHVGREIHSDYATRVRHILREETRAGPHSAPEIYDDATFFHLKSRRFEAGRGRKGSVRDRQSLEFVITRHAKLTQSGLLRKLNKPIAASWTSGVSRNEERIWKTEIPGDGLDKTVHFHVGKNRRGTRDARKKEERSATQAFRDNNSNGHTTTLRVQND